MTNDRMMQAIGRIDRAISRLEAAVEKGRAIAREREQALAQANARLETQAVEVERLTTALARREATEDDADHINPFSHEKAVAALRSLDALIDDLQKARRDG